MNLGTTVTWVPAAEPTIRLRSAAFGGEPVELPADAPTPIPREGWGRYVAAVVRLLWENGPAPLPDWRAEIVSTVPIGAGMSSSAALTVSVGLAVTSAASYELARIDMARIAQAAERLAVGVPVGLMDPASSLLGRKGHALLLDCGGKEHRLVQLPPESHSSSSTRVSGTSSSRAPTVTSKAELERALAAIGASRPSELDAAGAEAEAAAGRRRRGRTAPASPCGHRERERA